MLNEFKSLYEIMLRLRKECPWDKEQNNHTLINLTIEEVYELADAIYRDKSIDIKEELGDLFVHFIFYAILAEEKKDFTVAEILKTACDKLIFRHPHIFADAKKLNTTKEVLENWHKRKKLEGKQYTLSGVPHTMPSIAKAIRIQAKASAMHFDWDNRQQVYKKLNEELNELQKAIDTNTNIEEEFGDVLFTLINYARFIAVDPERALQRANTKFIDRFTKMEKITEAQNLKFIELPLSKKEELWTSIKNKNL